MCTSPSYITAPRRDVYLSNGYYTCPQRPVTSLQRQRSASSQCGTKTDSESPVGHFSVLTAGQYQYFLHLSAT